MRKPVMVIGLSTAAVVGAGGLGLAAWSPQSSSLVPVAGDEVVVYVSPPGDGAGGAGGSAGAGGDGMTAASSKESSGGGSKVTVTSLSEAANALREKGATKGTVLVKGGTYRGESFNWNYMPAGGEFTIKPQPGTGRPVFDGGGQDGYWTSVEAGGTRLHFRGMTVRNYVTGGIHFNGSTGGEGFSGGSVRNMVFERMGTISRGDKGYAALHLQNVTNMDIRDNDFWDLRNRLDKPAGTNPGQIHAIYFSEGGGRGSTVAGNTFYKITGDPVRASDGAGGIRVTGNRFKSTGWYGVFSFWRFDRDRTCSTGSTFSGNTYGNGHPRRSETTGKIVTKIFKGRPTVSGQEWKGDCKPQPIRDGSNSYAPAAGMSKVNGG
ncbi:right-handed parallel beta-helix repeat-containing protein [Spirillospora sp. NPDC048911]|uniref:right-handed parallel beta-helix repeat-containing protein n=1 Tax=Spirillospora sp. NPDC048911 TaxID=3364527 RepID=UPI00370F7A2E